MSASIDDPEILCLKKVSIKDATQICGGLGLILSLLCLVFVKSVINETILGLILLFASVLLIVGVRKKKTWMFIPFLWTLGASLWINPISFVICIRFYYNFRTSWMYDFHTPERKEAVQRTTLIMAIVNLIGTVFSLWIFTIVQKCYNLISFETTVIPFGNNRKPNFSLEDYITAEPKYEFCFGRVHVKYGTYFVCGVTLFCWIIGVNVGLINGPSVIFWTLLISLFVIACTVSGPIIGIWKGLPWLFLPMLWYLGTLMFTCIYEFLILIAYSLFPDHSSFSNNITLERKFESLHYKIPLNIFLTIFASWFFSIIHSCYVLICELKHAKLNPNSNIELKAIHEC